MYVISDENVYRLHSTFPVGPSLGAVAVFPSLFWLVFQYRPTPTHFHIKRVEGCWGKLPTKCLWSQIIKLLGYASFYHAVHISHTNWNLMRHFIIVSFLNDFKLLHHNRVLHIDLSTLETEPFLKS